MARTASTTDIAEIAALRKECANLRVQLATETARLEGAAGTALAECAEHRKELARLRARGQAIVEAYPSSPNANSCVAVPQQSSTDLVEALRELENLEHALVEERRRTAQLLEEKRVAEESHARDVEMLERMLQQVLAENERLSGQVAAWEVAKLGDVSAAELASANEVRTGVTGGLAQVQSKDGTDGKAGDTDVDEPEMEPRRLPVSRQGTDGGDDI